MCREPTRMGSCPMGRAAWVSYFLHFKTVRCAFYSRNASTVTKVDIHPSMPEIIVLCLLI